MNTKLDLIDKKLLCELDLNCRTPVSQLAKKLRINRNVLAYRIKHLEQEKVISNYICSINLNKLGYMNYKLYFKLHANQLQQEEQFVTELVTTKNIITLVKTEGAFDYTAAIVVRTIKDLDEFVTTLKSSYRTLIKDTVITVIVYSNVFKLHKLLLEQQQTQPKLHKYAGEEEKIILDPSDMLILKALSTNARRTLVELTHKTKLSLDIVKYRLKMLSATLVTAYRAIPSFEKLGYYHYVIMLKLNATTQREAKLNEWCLLKTNVLYCTKRIGSFDFEIHAAIKDIDEFTTFITELKKTFNDIIDSYETFLQTKLLKLNYVPF